MGTEFVLDTRYELIKPIGHGAYGVVISAMDHVAGSKVRRGGVLAAGRWVRRRRGWRWGAEVVSRKEGEQQALL